MYINIYIIIYILYYIYIYIILYILYYIYIYYIIYIILYIYYIIHIYIYMHIHTLLCIYMYYICILLLLCIYIYIPGLRKDTHNCPFARFLPSGRISCEGPGNCHFLTTVVKFAFRTFWADLTLLCINKFFLDRNSREKGGNNRETGGIPWQTQHDWNWKHEVVRFFLEIVILFWHGHFLFFMIEIEPKSAGQKFVANE